MSEPFTSWKMDDIVSCIKDKKKENKQAREVITKTEEELVELRAELQKRCKELMEQ